MPINVIYMEKIFNRFFGREGRSFTVSPKDPPDIISTSEIETSGPSQECPGVASLSSDSEVMYEEGQRR